MTVSMDKSKKNKVRVLHVFSGVGGGISSIILNLTENKTDDFIYDMLSFSYEGGEMFCSRVAACGATCYTMPRPRIEGMKVFFDYLDDFFSKHYYDAVHCHISGWRAKPFSKYARKHGVKHFFIHAHTTKYDSRIDRIPLVKRMNQAINYNLADCYFTCSDLAADYIFGKKYLKKKHLAFVPNGINENLFKMAIADDKVGKYRLEFNIQDGYTVLGHVGRFSVPKNHDEVLNIAKNLKDKKYKFVLLLVGVGERFEEIKSKAHDMKLDGNIRFVGYRTDICELMKFFDVMILPSLYEGLPTVAVECQASGTRIFLSDTITHQCDMQLGLASFLPLNDTSKWVDEITSNRIIKKNPGECVTHIASMGFTALSVGMNYCRELERILSINGE